MCPGLEVILELDEFEGFEEARLCEEFEDGSEDSG